MPLNALHTVQKDAELARVRGVTLSVSARRLEGDGFVARSKPCHS